MSDHGNILTYFESMFGNTIDHEVIKIILQSCDWDSNVAYEQLLSLTDNQVEVESNEEKISEPDPPLASSVVKQNGKPSSNTNFTSYSDVPEASHSEPPLSKIKFIEKLISEKKKILIIMRGLPGSGKSALAHSLNTNGVVLSTDDYFMDKFQNYNFNSSILPEAHKWNKDRAKLKLYNGVTPIFIDNTNLQLWEFEPYIRYALENGYYVDILEPDTYWKYNCKILSVKCVHDVPNKKIAEMKGRFETNLNIEDFLKRLKLSNNLNGIDINTYRSVSRNSDSEIVVEDDSSSDNGSSNENESPKRIPNTDILSHSDYSDGENKIKNDVKETAEVKNEEEQYGRVSITSDIENSMKKLSLSQSTYNKDGKEYSVTELLDSQNLDGTSEWNCVSSPSSISSTWTNLPSVKTNHCDTTSLCVKPQRYKKASSSNPNRNSDFKNNLVAYEVDDDDDDNDDEKDDIDWSPAEDFTCLTWENNTDPPKLSKGVPQLQEKLNCNSSNSKSSLQPQTSLKIHNNSQYCTIDISSSDNLATTPSLSSNFIQNPNTNAEVYEVCNNESLSDKGTMISDSCDSKENVKSCPLQKLKSFFPDIAEDDLEDFLQKCDYDVDWTMNILIDSGYKISSNISRKNSNASNVSVIECEPPSSPPVTQGSNGSNLTDESNSDSNEKDESSKNDDDLCSTSNPSLCTDDDDNDSGKEGAQYLTMEIDSQFGAQLINLYGPISSLNITSGFTKEDCRIVLPLELCHDIYKYWAKTLEGKFKYEKDILDMFIREDEELARKLQEEEENAVVVPATNEETKPVSFQEIVNMQSLEENKLRSKASKESVTYSSMLSLQKLQEEFAHVDPTAVEEEYFSQNLDYSATKTLLTYKYGPGTSAVPEAGAVATNSDEPTTEDWEDFCITVDDPQMYRDEAQIHYLERKKALEKAQEASQKGMKSVASYYAQIGNLHLQKFKEANERASKKILSAFNSKRGPNSLDLHMLHVEEALREAQRFLSERRNVLTHMNLKEMNVSIITGKGNHSAKGEARLKPAIRTFLGIEGYQFTEYGGCFKIVLRSRSSK